MKKKKPAEPAAVPRPPLSFPPLWSRLPSQFRLAFLSALAAGLVTHLYAFTNLVLSGDAVNNTFRENAALLTSGRWFLGPLSALSGNYQMPVVIGLVSLAAVALSAGLTVLFLDISHPAGAALSGVLMATYPSVACTLSYWFTADAYFIVLLMNAAAVYLTKKYRFGWLPAVLLITLSCGGYQAYFCFSAGLFLFDRTLALFSKESTKAVFLRGLKYIAILLAALLFYNLLTLLLLRLNNAVLNTYFGMDSIGRLNLSERLAAVPAAWKRFCSVTLHWPYVTPVLRPLHFAALALLAVSGLLLTVLEKLWKTPGRLALLVLCWLMIPLALNFVYVLAYKYTPTQLMTYSYVLLFVYAVKLAELAALRLPALPARRPLALYGAALLCCAVVAWNDFCLCNVGYHALTINYENSYAMANRIVARLEALEGYIPGETPVALVDPNHPPTAYGNYDAYSDYKLAIGLMNYNLGLGKNFILHYIGPQAPCWTSSQETALKNSETVQNMPLFPAEGSVAMVDGVAVVRIGKNTNTIK